MAPLLEMRGITRSFGGIPALRGVDLELRAGQVHALLGENGAGKSTLVRVLAGVLRPDGGSVFIAGSRVRMRNPRVAASAGVAMIHQELRLLENLDVAANVTLGREPRRLGMLLDRRGAERVTRSVLESLGVELDPRARVGDLRVGQKQCVEIARAISRDARILVMDEPTSALSEAEVRTLFEVIAALKARGSAVVYISHRLDEVFAVADTVTVLRDGRRVLAGPVAGLGKEAVIHAMLGRAEAVLQDAPPAAPRDPEVLRVEGLGLEASGGRAGPLSGIGFTVRTGEVVGLAGLLGSGRTEVLESLFGVHGAGRHGRVLLDGRPVPLRSVKEAMARGLALLPEDRAGQGLIPDRSARENLLLAAPRSLGGLLDRRGEHRVWSARCRELSLRCRSWSQQVTALSGGNQQKVVLGRWLETRPRVLLLDEPTRGIDMGAKAEVYRLVARLAATGLAVVLATSELPELLRLSHRLVVLRAGRQVEVVPAREADPRRVFALMSGAA